MFPARAHDPGSLPLRSPVRLFNFSPGPAVLPLEVLEQVRDELTDWQGRGMSVMEVGHRSKAFAACAAEAEADLRELLTIAAHCRVRCRQGGATAQFAVVLMDPTTTESVVDFVN